MIPTIDRVGLDTAAQLTLTTGYAVGWAPGGATYLTKIDGWWEPAPMRRDKVERIGRHGTFPEPGTRDERLISASGHHVAASRAAAAAYVDALAAFLGDGLGGVFRVDDADLGVRHAGVSLAPAAVDVKWSGGVDVGFTIHMVANDPRKYGEVVTDATGQAVEGGGLQWDLFTTAAGVMDYGAPGDPGSVTLANTGTAPTPVRFTVTGGSAPTGFTVRHQDTGRALTYGPEVFPGQTVIMDGRDGTVTLDGYDRGASLTRREWVDLDPFATGTWLLEASGATGLTLTAEVEPAWW